MLDRVSKVADLVRASGPSGQKALLVSTWDVRNKTRAGRVGHRNKNKLQVGQEDISRYMSERGVCEVWSHYWNSNELCLKANLPSHTNIFNTSFQLEAWLFQIITETINSDRMAVGSTSSWFKGILHSNAFTTLCRHGNSSYIQSRLTTVDFSCDSATATNLSQQILVLKNTSIPNLGLASHPFRCAYCCVKKAFYTLKGFRSSNKF